MSENLIIPRHLAQALMDYLATRPAGEVFQMMLALRSLQPLEETDGD